MTSQDHINRIPKYEENPQFTLNNSIESVRLRIIKEVSRPVHILSDIYTSKSIIYPFKVSIHHMHNPS
ncbi:hypothetical protein B5S30_g4850 [[Candida] boidinii]|nr:hypothetical protein B5S30_g4850 [[Candida] boidinii]